jgi:hypothetical protein
MNRRLHAKGDACYLKPDACWRWHTTELPVRVPGKFGWYWAVGTKWTDSAGDTHVSPNKEPSRALDYGYHQPVEPELLPRASLLREAEKLTCGDRNNQYGPPTQDFQRTAELLQALGYRRVDAEDTINDILPSDVAIIIAQVKMSRIMHSRDKRDSWVDLAGYSACGYECAVEEAEGDD